MIEAYGLARTIGVVGVAALLAACAGEIGLEDEGGPAPSPEVQAEQLARDEFRDRAARCSNPRLAPERAIEACTEVLALGEQTGLISDFAAAQALINRAYAYTALDDLPNALADYRFASERAPGLYDIWPNWGWSLMGAGRVEEALLRFDRGLEIDPLGRESALGRGVALLQLDRAAEALEPLEIATAGDPDDAYGWRQLGAARAAVEDPVGAIDALNRALEVRRRYDEARLARAALLEDIDVDAALADYDLVVMNDPENPNGYAGRAQLLDRLGRREESDRDARVAYALGARGAWIEARIAEIGAL